MVFKETMVTTVLVESLEFLEFPGLQGLVVLLVSQVFRDTLELVVSPELQEPVA